MIQQDALSVARFVKVLEAAGVDDAARARLHRVFERDDPSGHALFLAALNLSPEEVERHRVAARA